MANNTIVLRPDRRQLLADNIGKMIITAIILIFFLPLVERLEAFPCIVFGGIIMALLGVIEARYLELRNTRWIISDETICKESGILSRRKDYIELYRVADYMETQTLFQRFFGVKTVSIVSTDKLDKIKNIDGVPVSMDMVKDIRGKVERCKQGKRIYEITNN